MANQPTFDSDGYPTEDTLRVIAAWPVNELDDLVPFVCEAWSYPDRAQHDEAKATLYLSTGGWSGNEDIIEALEKNFAFWWYWFKSQRGGHYWFRLRGYKDAAN